MKVWVLTRFAHQSFRCLGVFSSREKAEEYAEKLALNSHRKEASRQERRMKKETVINRYWEDLQLDLTEEEVDPVVSD